jgi:hypothetical protein
VTQTVDAVCHNFPNTASQTDHDRPPARQSLQHDEAKRLGRRAGMHDDIKGAQGGLWGGDKSCEPDAVGNPKLTSQSHQLSTCVLTSFRLVESIADDVRANWNMRRQPGDSLQKDLMPLPARERPEQPDPNCRWIRWKQAGQRIEIRPIPMRRESLEVHGIKN